MAPTMSFYNLRDALPQPGCVVCRLKASAVDRFLDGLLWECVNDPDTRRNIRQARGFCQEHAWRLVHGGASLGATIIMRDVLHNVLETLEGGKFQALPGLSLRRVQEALNKRQPSAATAELAAALTSHSPCLACEQAATMEGVYLDTLLDHLLGEDGLLAAFQASDGLCLPHFRQALALVRDEAVFEALVSTQRAVWGQVVAHLDEIIRKSDYRFQDEARGEETGACRRAIAALVGAQPEEGPKKIPFPFRSRGDS
jgi:hypothetical protein